jgi:hypothetical protein
MLNMVWLIGDYNSSVEGFRQLSDVFIIPCIPS